MRLFGEHVREPPVWPPRELTSRIRELAEEYGYSVDGPKKPLAFRDDDTANYTFYRSRGAGT